MDFWAVWGLAASAILLAFWLVAAGRAKAGAAAILVGLAHLGVAAFHAAAPIRGLIDPNYAGYEFGVLRAEGGWAVTATAGAVLIIALVGAFNALGRDRRARIRTAAASTLFLVNLGGAWLYNALAGLRGNAIQFGDALTIPGEIGTLLIFALFIAPFVLGTVWAGRRALSAA